jgi:hypothetical protein
MLCTSSASRWPELLAPGGVATAASVTVVSAGVQQQWRSHARGRGDSAVGRVGRSSRQLGRSSLALREARIMPASRRQLEQGSVMGELGDPPPLGRVGPAERGGGCRVGPKAYIGCG